MLMSPLPSSYLARLLILNAMLLILTDADVRGQDRPTLNAGFGTALLGEGDDTSLYYRAAVTWPLHRRVAVRLDGGYMNTTDLTFRPDLSTWQYREVFTAEATFQLGLKGGLSFWIPILRLEQRSVSGVVAI